MVIKLESYDIQSKGHKWCRHLEYLPSNMLEAYSYVLETIKRIKRWFTRVNFITYTLSETTFPGKTYFCIYEKDISVL